MFTNPPLINEFQPPRPRHCEESGRVLLYRTRPKYGKTMINIHTYANQVCMMSLYRAVRRGEVPLQVGIGDLYDWISNGGFSKRNLGSVVVNSVIYEPRLMMNRRETGPMMTYLFRDIRELEYGLEWMLCVWLRRFLNQLNAHDEQITTTGAMAEELDMLANASDEEFADIYLGELAEFHMAPMDWHELSQRANHEWTFDEVLPEDMKKPQDKEKPRTPPRDLSVL